VGLFTTQSPLPATFQGLKAIAQALRPFLTLVFFNCLLVDSFAQPGIEEATEKWRTDKPSPPGLVDGWSWKEIQGHNKTLFFAEYSLTEDGELCTGANISLDWFDHFHMSRKVPITISQISQIDSKPPGRRIEQAIQAA
jgi:hypothetical protein